MFPRLFFLIFLTSLNCSSAVAAGADSLARDTVITLERTACYGMCPVYSLVIHSDGLVHFDGKESVRTIGQDSARISPDSVRKLLNEFERIGYWDLKESYYENESGMTVTDLPTQKTSLQYGSKRKEVVNYFGAPSELSELEHLIDNVVNIDRWTHTPEAIDCACISLLRTSDTDKRLGYRITVTGEGAVWYQGQKPDGTWDRQSGRIYPSDARYLLSDASHILLRHSLSKPLPLYSCLVDSVPGSDSLRVMTFTLQNETSTVKNYSSAAQDYIYLENMIDYVARTSEFRKSQ